MRALKLNQEGNSTPWAAFGPSEHVPAQLNAPTCFSHLRKWIHACESHPSCLLPSTTLLPKRVLDLGHHRFRNTISLLETDGKTYGRFVTLSHCWGKLELLKTSAKTLSRRKTGIRWSELPRTFQDAITICRELHVQYLWIDSLCILQDDTLDWEQESAKMAMIYSRSYLNIAATRAPDSSAGCFSIRWIEMDAGSLQKTPTKSYEIKGQPGSHSGKVFARLSLDEGHRDFEHGIGSGHYQNRAPLLSRAWVFQERCLASRTLHFHAGELIWECKAGLSCECKTLDSIPRNSQWQQRWESQHLYLRNAEVQETGMFWFNLVVQFSALRLIYESDRLPALSGIASYFEAPMHSKYLAGMWEGDLARALLWYIGPAWSSVSGRPLPLRAPTWSWASIDLDKDFNILMYPFLTNIYLGFTADPSFRIVEAYCQTKAANPYGAVQDGSLTIQAQLVPTILTKDHSITQTSTELVIDVDVDEEDLVKIDHDNMRPDVSLNGHNSIEVPSGTVVYCVLVGRQELDSSGRIELPTSFPPIPATFIEYALVLRLSNPSKKKFQRIGLLETPKYSGWFDRPSKDTFVIE